ncbi:hypothetical protein [Parasitella parasitica]|uniref:RdRp catalytic domain-containing protein n=1 Tax=Parasitella parasitica TaxID=35722 RepID=A0A0B7NBP0_9FUNG|nr:hypothetical protein [Parasitella parasitica]
MNIESLLEDWDEIFNDMDDIYSDFLGGEKSTNEFLSQNLDNPLVDIPMVKLSIAADINSSLKDKNRLRSGCNLKSEQWFVAELKKSEFFKKHMAKLDIFNARLIAYFCQMIRRSPDCPENRRRMWPNFESTIALSQDLDAILSNWTKTNINRYDMSPVIQAMKEDTLLTNYYQWMMTLENFYDVRRNKSSNGDRRVDYSRIGDDFMIALSGQFCTLRFGAEGVVLGSLDCFLCLLDIVRIRFNTRAATYVLKIYSIRDIIEQQYVWQESCIIRYGEAGYEILKSTEPMWKCWVSRISGGSYQEHDAYDRMIIKIRDKEVKLMQDNPHKLWSKTGWIEKINFASGSVSDYLIDDLSAICRKVDNVDIAVELFGITKSTGHPVLNPAVGGASAREHVKADANLNSYAMTTDWCIFCHLILINYIKKHQRWPPLTFHKSNFGIIDGITSDTDRNKLGPHVDYKTTKLFRLYRDKALIITNGLYDLDDWYFCDFDQIFEFDHHDDYLHLLKDKSCAPPLTQLKQFYEGRNIDRAARRILRIMLTETKTDTKALIRQFANDTLSEEEYNILLYPKECEFKVAARMFCMLTFHIRLIFSIIQENVKEGIFSLLPYQSMTMSNQELIRKLMSMITPNSSEETLFIEIDLSRWNLCFRNLYVRGFGRRMDQLFGVDNIFGRSHEVFSRSLITVLVRDQKIPQLDSRLNINNRRLVDSDTMWRNHHGGFEGIDQATWTVATICMIFRALWSKDCRFVLLGQGDNQKLAITRRKNPSESISDFSTRIMQRIESCCFDVNHIAKPEEFVDSKTTLTYSKVFIVRGQVIPMKLKFAMKVSPLTASEIPSFFDSLGSIHSSAIGAATNSDDPLSL